MISFRFSTPFVIAATMAVTIGAPLFANDAKTVQTHIDTMQWYPTPFGPTVSPVSGDLANGAHITIVRFEPGMKSDVHVHSRDYTGVVIQGTGQHYEEDRPETKIDLPPGSHWVVPANVPHVSTCTSEIACMFVLYQDDAFDFIAHEHN